MIVVPDDDTLLASIDKSLATTSTTEAGPSSDVGEEPMDTDEIVSKSSSRPSREEGVAASDVAPISSKPSSEPSKKHQTLVTVQGKEKKWTLKQPYYGFGKYVTK